MFFLKILLYLKNYTYVLSIYWHFLPTCWRVGSDNSLLPSPVYAFQGLGSALGLYTPCALSVVATKNKISPDVTKCPLINKVTSSWQSLCMYIPVCFSLPIWNKLAHYLFLADKILLGQWENKSMERLSEKPKYEHSKWMRTESQIPAFLNTSRLSTTFHKRSPLHSL